MLAVEDPGALPLAVGAAEQRAPSDSSPASSQAVGIDRGRDVHSGQTWSSCAGCAGRESGALRVGEEDHFDGLAARQDDAADGLGLIGPGTHSIHPRLGPISAGRRTELDPAGDPPDSFVRKQRTLVSRLRLEVAVMPFSVGPLELIIVLVIVLVIFGPKRLPGLDARSVRGCASSRTRSRARTTRAGAQDAGRPSGPQRPPSAAKAGGEARGQARGRAGRGRGTATPSRTVSGERRG